MYAHDAQTTNHYRTAILEMGFAPAHAEMLQVDMARSDRRLGQPLYRVTTGTDVLRGGAIMRRVLMMWYVHSDAEATEETRNREDLADMIVATVSFLPRATAALMPPLPAWAEARADAVASGIEAPARQAA